MSLKKFGESLQEKFINSKDEEKKLLKIFHSFPKNVKILDVGCGYGRNIDLLKKNNFKNIIGVEVNESIVENNKKKGFECYNPGDFTESFKNESFDIVLMSHIVEHFNPSELRGFLEKYLAFLEKSGRLVIATPVMTNFFYVDFDHIRPYDPNGLSMFFSDNSQIQFYSHCKMKLENLYFRRSPFKLKNFRSLYVRKDSIPVISRLPSVVNLLLAILFKISGGLIGRVTGWIGEYKKV